MKQLINLSTPDGEVLFETSIELEGVRPAGKIGDVIKTAESSLQASLKIVTALSSAIQKSISELGNMLESAEVEFGLKVGGKGSMYVVETSAEASIKVTLSFKFKE